MADVRSAKQSCRARVVAVFSLFMLLACAFMACSIPSLALSGYLGAGGTLADLIGSWVNETVFQYLSQESCTTSNVSSSSSERIYCIGGQINNPPSAYSVQSEWADVTSVGIGN